MIGILIVWLIIGILLASLSGLLYYNDALGFLGFSVIFVQGIVILLVSAFSLISLQTRRKESGKSNNRALKRMFTALTAISIIVFVLGILGYLVSAFGVLTLDLLTTNTLLAFLTFGLFGIICGILSLVYLERSMPDAILAAIIQQQNVLNKMKSEFEEIGSEIRSIEEYLKKSHEYAMEIEEKNKKELERR